MASRTAPADVPTDTLHPDFRAAFHHFVQTAATLADEPGGMGEMEEALDAEIRDLLRQALERATQKKADGADHSRCPVCQEKLQRITEGHQRTVRTRHGEITFSRAKGYCPKCEQWRLPADDLLGLDKHATASPGIQKASALLVSKMPSSEAEKVMRELTGLPADDSTMAREAQRQGERAKAVRRRMDEQACHTEGRWKVTEQVRKELGTAQAAFTLVVEMDAVLIRERDCWGESEALRDRGESLSRWHWIYAATIYRLDQRGENQSGRGVILFRGYVATREGLESFSQQVYGESVRQGLLLAANVLVIADGGVWIWKIAEDRFPHARRRLDFYHASQHLHAVAALRFGEDKAAADAWLKPLLHQLRHGGEAGVVQTLQDLAEVAEGVQKEDLVREANYFKSHERSFDYAGGANRGEPIGSGAIESTCRQLQCRFKRPGQFWSQTGDDALLALETFWRNGRWKMLFPARCAAAAARS